MKKLMSTVLSAVLLLAICCTVPFASAAESIGWDVHEDVDLRVGIVNDTHMRNADATTDIVNHILDSQVEISGGKIDGMALIGDVTFYNAAEDCTDLRHYRNMYASINEKMPGAPILYAMGNHEFPFGLYDAETSAKAHAAFIEGTGQTLNDHQVFGDGYHFIAVAPESASSDLGEETKAWAMQEIENAIAADSSNAVLGDDGNYSFAEGEIPDSTKPVFVLIHAPMPETVLWGSNGGDVTEFVSYLKTRPQVVVLHGHLHASAFLPETIWQDGFTAFQSSINDGHYIDDKAFTEKDTSQDAYLHQGSMLEVDNNIVKIYKLDYDNNREIGEPWVVDVPQIVANLRDDNPDNDTDAYLYTDEKRADLNSNAVFPESAEITVEHTASGMYVTYPNTAYMEKSDAVQQDNFIRGYQVEVATKSGTVVSKLSHQADYYKLPENRAASYRKLMGGLTADTDYVVKVYPIMPFGDLGEPITAETTTPALDEDTIRYEFEDYCPEESLNKETEFASGGGLTISAQGGMVDGVAQLARPADDTSPFTFDFEVDLPVDGTYGVEYAVGYMSSAYLSEVILAVDDTVIGNNKSKGYDDRSIGNTYPWSSHIPLYGYDAGSLTLSAGKHTVTVTVNLPTTTAKKQPYLFCADYIQFTPETPMLDLRAAERVEMEDYANRFYRNEEGKTPITPTTIGTSENASGGKYVHFDTVAEADHPTIRLDVPVYVKEAGNYILTYAATSNLPCRAKLYLDGTALSISSSELLDVDGKVDGKYPYFAQSSHRATKYTVPAAMTAGSHTVMVEFSRRTNGTGYDVALCMDYLDFAPVTDGTVTKDSICRVELEDCIDGITPLQQSDGTTYTPAKTASAGSSGGAYMRIDSTDGLSEVTTYDVPLTITVKDTGYYNMEYVVCGNDGIPAPKVYLNDTGTVITGTRTYVDSSDNGAGAYQYFDSSWATAGFYNGTVYLKEGIHTVIFRIARRSGTKDFAQNFDYLEFTPVDAFEIADGTATAVVTQDEAVTGKVILALYNGKNLVNMAEADVENQRRMTITASAAGTVTHAKVFVWSSLTDVTPLTAAKVFAVNEAVL